MLDLDYYLLIAVFFIPWVVGILYLTDYLVRRGHELKESFELKYWKKTAYQLQEARDYWQSKVVDA